MLISIIIFVVTYALIIWDKFDRAAVALTGAGAMILFKILSQENAFKEVDFNTLGLLIGMMMIVMVTKRTGVFEYSALKLVKVAKADPVKIIILLSIMTGVVSAFLDNVTTILLVLPVTLGIAKDLKLSPIPFIISEVFASNVGGTATLIGDPPNILIGSATGIDFVSFLQHNGPIILIILFITTMIFAFRYKGHLKTNKEIRESIMEKNENELLKNKKLLVKSLSVLGIVIIGFLLHGLFHYESATIAMIGGVVLVLISGIKAEKIFHEVEWKTIFFFIGLFILVGGLKESGVIDRMAQGLLDVTGGNLTLAVMAILWVSAIASAFLDNIPFVTTMIPLIKHMGAISGMDVSAMWWALSLGACLGGNGTIIGASANVIAVGMAEELGCKISFWEYMKEAFLPMLLTIGISTIYIFVVYLR